MTLIKPIEKVAAHLVAHEDLFLDSAQKKVVVAGDPRAAFLLARKGQVIPPNLVKALGLTEKSEPEKLLEKPVKGDKGVEPSSRSTRPQEPGATR